MFPHSVTWQFQKTFNKEKQPIKAMENFCFEPPKNRKRVRD